MSDIPTGLVHFGIRDYEVETGRWISRDKLLFSGGQANLYDYVNGNPVNLADPMGTALSIGGSLYSGGGGGGQITIGLEGFAFCSEVGAGAMIDISFDPFAEFKKEESASYFATVEGNFLMIESELTLETPNLLDPCVGDVKLLYEQCMGPICFTAPIFGSDDEVGIKAEVGLELTNAKKSLKREPTSLMGGGFKAGLKVCTYLTW